MLKKLRIGCKKPHGFVVYSVTHTISFYYANYSHCILVVK